MNLKTKGRERLRSLQGSFGKQEKWSRKRGEKSGFSNLDVEDEVETIGETKRRGFQICNQSGILIGLFVWVLSLE